MSDEPVRAGQTPHSVGRDGPRDRGTSSAYMAAPATDVVTGAAGAMRGMGTPRAASVCRPWVRTYPGREVCPRCRHEAHLNTDGLCKPCPSAIRAEGDAADTRRTPGTNAPPAVQDTPGGSEPAPPRGSSPPAR